MTDREKLIELIGTTQYGNNTVGENFQEGFIAKIADHLIANGVEIPVRCKDCKYWEKGKDYEAYCNHWAGMLTDTVEDDYCSYGERRTE